MLAVVHGDTSTTVHQPLDELGAICARHGVLFYTDATASVGGNALAVDAWGIDAVSAGLQKCLGGPSGSAPVTLSPRAVAVHRRAAERRGRHPRTRWTTSPTNRSASNYFDLAMILDYWGPRRLNHHTEADYDALRAPTSAPASCSRKGSTPSSPATRLPVEAMLAGVQGARAPGLR